MTLTKTDNDNLSKKLSIRLFAIDRLQKSETEPIRVLDCFAGDGLLWHYLKKESGHLIKHVGIDTLPKQGALYLGDNRRYLHRLSIDNYDLIDIDAYGVPYCQMKILAEHNYRGIVVGTFIQCVYGGLPYAMLEDIGYSRPMVQKITKLFFSKGWNKCAAFLRLLGYEEVYVYHCANKHYFCCIPTNNG
ncbi:MAG: hypothetical protein FWE67_00015 [Planctomycetaceae bacterium]|nr:hypothetical protein [Planctomycetaceae bacterium]